MDTTLRDLPAELRKGKVRLEAALHLLSQEQCEKPAALPSGSVLDALSQIVSSDFLALRELSRRLTDTSVSGFTVACAEPRTTRAHPGLLDLLEEFRLVRSALIRLVESLSFQRKSGEQDWSRISELCIRRFNGQVAELDRWRNFQIVGFSAERLRQQSRETELNAAISALSRQDFEMTTFGLSRFFLNVLGRFYSEDFVFWIGPEATAGKAAAFERLADILEPVFTILEARVAYVHSLVAHSTFQDCEGNFVTCWEVVLGGTYGTRILHKWKTVRVWKSRLVVAERMVGLTSANNMAR